MTIKDNNTYISFDITENIHQNIRLYKKLNAEKEMILRWICCSHIYWLKSFIV